ncbi:hypothetical protein DCC81_17930 [Chitinophaga parva]|uniref:Uncharacterized protein n=1 Tax=Chitinophaga parva TaxID=2169414 RepID=A0A2T7BIM0_9BACT|nr:hypothetical protein DCC81_17930 [Chitinophaga parva]
MEARNEILRVLMPATNRGFMRGPNTTNKEGLDITILAHAHGKYRSLFQIQDNECRLLREAPPKAGYLMQLIQVTIS